MNVVADRQTNRFAGVVVVGLFAVALTAITKTPGPLFVGAFAVIAGIAAHTLSPPSPELAVERSVSETAPAPGRSVTVSLTLKNEGGYTLTDLRVLDGVPDALTVVEGSPRLATALQPGHSATVTYAVEPKIGPHEFGDVTLLVRDIGGVTERELTATATGDDSLRVTPTLSAATTVPLREQLTPYVGRIPTDSGGAGAEFYATREYQHGDPQSRIDWRRVARTGDLTTVSFRRERAGSVVLVVDTRSEAHVGTDDSAVARGLSAAATTAGALLDGGDRVGLLAFGPTETWLAPGAGDAHRSRLRELLGTNPAFTPSTRENETFHPWLARRRLRRRLDGGTQLVVFSPLADEFMAETVRTLQAHGYPVTVVSPDPTGTETTGQRLARLERRVRLSTLRRAEIRVFDWGDEPFETAIAAASRRWSA